jgi:DNA-binding PadR family transcriptional regulator
VTSPLNATAACVLGLLELGPAPGQQGSQGRRPFRMTGWQITETAKVSISRFWNVTRSQIYRELGRLEEAGLVARAGGLGPRASRPYRITGAGKRAFRGWVEAFAAGEPEDEQLHSPLVLSVFFGELLPPPLLKRVLTEHRARHERSLARLKVMTAALKKGGPPRLPSAVLRRGLAYQQLMLDWIDEVLTELRTTAAGR